MNNLVDKIQDSYNSYRLEIDDNFIDKLSEDIVEKYIYSEKVSNYKLEIVEKLFEKYQGKKINQYKRVTDFLKSSFITEDSDIRGITYSKREHCYNKNGLIIMFVFKDSNKFNEIILDQLDDTFDKDSEESLGLYGNLLNSVENSFIPSVDEVKIELLRLQKETLELTETYKKSFKGLKYVNSVKRELIQKIIHDDKSCGSLRVS